MISELSQLINTLEKLNIRLNTEIVGNEKVNETKNILMHLRGNHELLMKVIQKAKDRQNYDVEEVLTHMNECLDDIVQDLDNFHNLIILAMDRYCDYLDQVEETKN